MDKRISKKGYQYLGKMLLKYLPLIVIIMLLSGLDSFAYTYVPLFIQFIFSALSDPVPSSNLPLWISDIFLKGDTIIKVVVYAAIGLALYQLLRGILKFVAGIYRQTIGQTISRDIRKSLYEHIQTLPYSYHNNSDTGDLIQRCTSDIDVIQNFLCQQLPEIISVFAILFSSLYQMSRINGKLTLVSTIIIPVAFISSFIYCRYVEKKYEKIEESESELMTIMQENIGNVRVVKAFANEYFELKRFEKQNRDYATKNLKLQKTSALFWGIGDATTMAQLMLTMIVSINLVRSGDTSMTIANITAIITLVGSYIWPVRGLGRMIADMGKCSVSGGRIKDILNLNSEFDEDGVLEPIIEGGITFNNVSFKFDDANNLLLKNLNLDIKPGETIAIVGKTGSGKSTIAKILTRLMDYQDGEILIDNTPIRNIRKQYLRSQIGLILQDTFLYSRSVYDNIAITKVNATFDEVKKAAKTSAVHQDIINFEKGYDTIVGEKGATLSGGQKQRVAIARMLLKDKPIVIFDDSLSAVDTETDRLIRKALKESNIQSTVIIITHRITTAKQADRIVVLDNETISDVGTHEELSVRPGLYKKMWDIQKKLEDEFKRVLGEEVELHE